MKGHEAKRKPGAGQIAAASVNLTKNLIGAGIFTLPSALRAGSVVPGLCVMLTVALVQGSTFILIAFLCQKLHVTTYRGAFCAAFGKSTGNLVDGCILVNAFFGCVAYYILVADFLQKALLGLFGMENTSRALLILVATLAATLPLSHARNLAPLRYTSMLGLAIIAFVIAYVFCDFLGNLDTASENLREVAFRPSLGMFSTLALCTGAFQAHYNAPRLFIELGCDLRAHACTVVCSFGTAFVIYSTFAVAGLGLFGKDVLGNVLKNYPAEGNKAVLAAWFGMAFAILCTFPLVFTTGRESLIGMVPALQRAGKASPLKAHVAITSSMVAAIALVACVVEDVSLITGMLGATVGACLCWIFPASVYLKTSAAAERGPADEPLLPKRGAAAQVPRNAALACYAKCMILVGLLSMGVGVSKTLGVI